MEDFQERALIRRFFDERRTGFFIEVGANDPFHRSQTWHLEELGWHGILVEPQPKLAELLRKERPKARIFETAFSASEKRGKATLHVAQPNVRSSLKREDGLGSPPYVETIDVTLRTLDELLAECSDPHPDFISIDTEGTELDVLRGFDLARHRPYLILIEDARHNLTKHRYLKKEGYKLVRRTHRNSWYVPKDCAPDFLTLPYRLKLFRWMYLDLAFRNFRRWRRRRARPE